MASCSSDKCSSNKCCRRKFCRIGLGVFIVMIAAALFLVPCVLAMKIPSYIKENVSPYITVEHAAVSLYPPALHLNGVHIASPEGFEPGDAVRIGKMSFFLRGFIGKPLYVHSALIQDVGGSLEMKDDVDNFSPILQSLVDNENRRLTGWVARPVVIEGLNIRNAHLKNVSDTVAVKLADANYDAISTTDAPVTIHRGFIEVFKTVVSQQQNGVIKLVAKGVGDKARDTIKSIGQAIKSIVE